MVKHIYVALGAYQCVGWRRGGDNTSLAVAACPGRLGHESCVVGDGPHPGLRSKFRHNIRFPNSPRKRPIRECEAFDMMRVAERPAGRTILMRVKVGRRPCATIEGLENEHASCVGHGGKYRLPYLRQEKIHGLPPYFGVNTHHRNRVL